MPLSEPDHASGFSIYAGKSFYGNHNLQLSQPKTLWVWPNRSQRAAYTVLCIVDRKVGDLNNWCRKCLLSLVKSQLCVPPRQSLAANGRAKNPASAGESRDGPPAVKVDLRIFPLPQRTPGNAEDAYISSWTPRERIHVGDLQAWLPLN